MANVPILIVVTPLLAAFLIHLTKYTRLKRGAELVSFFALIFVIFDLISVAPMILTGGIITYSVGGWAAPIGIDLRLDAFSLFFAVMVLGVAFLIVVYSLGIYLYARRYYSLLLIALTGILGIIMARDLFNMYVFFEILAVASYVLIAYKHKPRTLLASLKYLVMTETTWIFFLLGIAILYSLTGSLNMDVIASQMPQIYNTNPLVVYVVFTLMLVSFGIKCGMFPLYTWIPEAHSQAPTPVSGLLSGLILKVGIYAMLRIFYLFFAVIFVAQGIGNVLVVFGLVTLLFGAGMALVQDELKKLLAYSSISQIGFILVAIGLGTAAGLTGGLFHIFNHAVIKAALFFCAGIIISQSGFWKVSQMRGIWRQMPKVTFVFCLLSLAIIGIPPFNGFVSKLFIIEAVLQKQNFFVLFFLFVGIVLTAAYYFRVIQTFFSPEEYMHKPDFLPRPVGPFEHLSTYVFALACLLIGIFPVAILNLIEPAIKVLLP